MACLLKSFTGWLCEQGAFQSSHPLSNCFVCLFENGSVGGVAQMVERSLSMREVRGSMPLSSTFPFFFSFIIILNHYSMSLKELESGIPMDNDSEEDEEIYIPIPYRFHDLAQQGEFQLLNDEIKRYMRRDYNPNVRYPCSLSDG